MIEVIETKVPGVKLVKRRPIHQDHRGIYGEIYSEEEYFRNGITIKFVEDDFSFSKKGVLRGMHGDDKTWKLVSCPFGRLHLVVINYDKDSEHFGKWESFELNPDNCLQVLIPPKHGNGHLVLSDWAMFHYKQSEYYTDGGNQFVIRWNDPRFNIPWPIKDPILSPRDGGKS